MTNILTESFGSKIFFLFLSVGLFYMCSNMPKEIHGHMNGLDDPQTVTFEAKEGQKLTAKMTTPEGGNIRFNQIVSPTGQADGPFGQDIEYDLNETGAWKLIIGGSLMQGDSYNGDFTVTLSVE
ncbi:MAG: hypothetical protein LIO93_05280 [Bacteroidales bacterium]|nr:hypothetical protein [Bacteroidales bacterium]